MIQGKSIRAEIDGTVLFHNVKLSPAKKVLLPGAIIFIRPEHEESITYKFEKPFLFYKKNNNKKANVIIYNAYPVEIGDTIAELKALFDGKIAKKKSKLILSNNSKKEEYELSNDWEILVKNNQKVKKGEILAQIVSPISGIIRIETFKKDPEFVNILEIMDGEAHEIPENFTVKVKNNQEIEAGTLIATGYLQE